MGRPYSAPGKARREPIRGAVAQAYGLPRLFREAEGECFDRDRLMLLIALKPLLWSSAPRSSLRRQRGCARWPDRGVGTDPCHIPHADGGDLRSQAGVVAVAGIHQDHTLRPSGRSRRFDLLKGDLRLGLKNARLRHFGFVPSRLIRGPIFRQIELIRDRQGGIMIGPRQRLWVLARVLLSV